MVRSPPSTPLRPAEIGELYEEVPNGGMGREKKRTTSTDWQTSANRDQPPFASVKSRRHSSSGIQIFISRPPTRRQLLLNTNRQEATKANSFGRVCLT